MKPSGLSYPSYLKVSNPGTFYRLAASGNCVHRNQQNQWWRASLSESRSHRKQVGEQFKRAHAPIVQVPNGLYRQSQKPSDIKTCARCAHHFPPRFGVKQDYGDPFGLSMVCAVVFHPGRYEGAWGRSRKGRDYFRRKNNKSSEAAGEKKYIKPLG